MATLDEIRDHLNTTTDQDVRQELLDTLELVSGLQADVRVLYDGLVSLALSTDNPLPRNVRMRFKS